MAHARWCSEAAAEASARIRLGIHVTLVDLLVAVACLDASRSELGLARFLSSSEILEQVMCRDQEDRRMTDAALEMMLAEAEQMAIQIE
jgi:hypothetical protein